MRCTALSNGIPSFTLYSALISREAAVNHEVMLHCLSPAFSSSASTDGRSELMMLCL